MASTGGVFSIFYRPRQSTSPYKHALGGRNSPLDLIQAANLVRYALADISFVLPLATLQQPKELHTYSGPNVEVLHNQYILLNK